MALTRARPRKRSRARDNGNTRFLLSLSKVEIEAALVSIKHATIALQPEDIDPAFVRAAAKLRAAITP